MTQFKVFTFNEFQENCYILYDEKECIIFDPGCKEQDEVEELRTFLSSHGLTPTLLINTHCHLDHIFGNHYIQEYYDLRPHIHKEELFFLENLSSIAAKYGISATPSPAPAGFLEGDADLDFKENKLRIYFTPGHSPGSLSFYSEELNILISGDVLFRESIGRTDLPGGDFDTLQNSIVHLYKELPDETIVLPGHGPHTTIGHEKRHNPFVSLP